MRDVIRQLDKWRKDNQELAVATVINTWGSAPRPVGSKMVITRDSSIAGSVSAGCVENAVIEEANVVMSNGLPVRLKYGVADEDAWSVGLACGGSIEVFVEPGYALDETYSTVKELLDQREPFVMVTTLEGKQNRLNKKWILRSDGSTSGSLALSDEIKKQASSYLENGNSGIIEVEEGESYFIEVYQNPPRLIIIGAVHLAESLITIANATGFDTILIDPRKAFATKERFPHVNKLIQEWPQEALPEMELNHSAYLVILTHDPKLDDPALKISLRSNARYVGALGSKRTNQKRIERMQRAGLTESEISKLHAPIGLDIGGRTQGEIAISIMAEIVREKNRGKS